MKTLKQVEIGFSEFNFLTDNFTTLGRLKEFVSCADRDAEYARYECMGKVLNFVKSRGRRYYIEEVSTVDRHAPCTELGESVIATLFYEAAGALRAFAYAARESGFRPAWETDGGADKNENTTPS